jgi:hypothetical protein
MISAKQAIHNRFQNINLSKGILQALQNEFYKQHRGTFPYKSLKSLLKALEWPASYEFIGDYPSNRQCKKIGGWCEDIQGVTHDDHNWFFTQSHTLNWLWKIPVSHDLNHSVGNETKRVGIPPGEEFEDYVHFGDPDHYKGFIYVPFETSSRKKLPVVLAFEAKTLNFKGHAKLVDQGEKDAPWCAINPLNGLLYSSGFNLDLSKGYLHVYKQPEDLEKQKFTLEYLGQFQLYNEMGLPLTIKRVQGGGFSKNGHLYLVSDAGFGGGEWPHEAFKGNWKEGGIMGFDMMTGRRVMHEPVKYIGKWSNPSSGVWIYEGEELEGITIWDLDSVNVPGIGGQFHLTMLDNDVLSPDQIYFKHFRVKKEDREKI